eukprot:TRINITY_DN1658_c0_g1_i2.p1 TRINITY_DN1658_c0_g1~~TRINITY_DN1658_c0_g1_i2.p1  ORF type:complete len:189 (+),score=33.41 TRINITY_DN1658_c0_g1_i2:166-732(+)
MCIRDRYQRRVHGAQEPTGKLKQMKEILNESVPTKEVQTKRAYTCVSSEQRKELLELILRERMTIKDAAERLKMNYSNAKSIVRIFSKERRIEKLSHDLLRKRGKPESDFNVTLSLVSKVQPVIVNSQVAPHPGTDIQVQNSTEGSNNNAPKKSQHLSPEELSRISFDMCAYSSMISQRYFSFSNLQL